MNLWESIAVALEGLLANKMRSVLTMLGVIIGVAAVITMLAIAQGASRQMNSQIQQIGTNVLMVFQRRGDEGTRAKSLTLKDVTAIEKGCPSVLRVAPEVRGSATVKFRNKDTSTSIIGVTSVYGEVRNYKLADGDFFTQRDVDALRKVAVLGSQVAEDLFGTLSPVGQDIRINGTRFRVLGVLQSKGSGGFGNADDQLFVPLTTAMRRLFGLDDVNMISIQARSFALMDAAKSEVETSLRQSHGLGEKDDLDFNVANQADILSFANQASKIFTMLLGGIASVSLLVGGIGIMNIMLVSVTERTREIGIRMALGARRRDIRIQFLVEALVLSLLGGMMGILFGTLLSLAIATLIKWQFAVSLSSVLLAFGFAAAVGIFFGYYPASKASKMDPIEALRYE